MGILLKSVRIAGFRGLDNIEVSLEPVTVLTGMNNSGKTSFLKALQIVFGNRQFISLDDFSISDNLRVEKIIIDVKLISVDEKYNQKNTFDDEWEILFTTDRIRDDIDGNQVIPLRTIVTPDFLRNTFKAIQYIQQEWVSFKNDKKEFWYQSKTGTEKGFFFEEMPFFYMDAQRDIIEDMKAKSSYLGKMLSNIQYSKADIEKIESQIKDINEQAVKSSDILTNIETTLKELDTAMDNSKNGVDITPFPKKVRDLNKGISIQYSDFSMEYHGMGTRSWSSLLTLKSFISLFDFNSEKSQEPFFPIVALEEPEAHLHPNAQKKLFNQILGISGQKIIATHSAYIAASAELNQIRSFYKDNKGIKCGLININDFDTEDIRKIKRQVINTRGELFFSKAIVLFEGETEEQALPIFADKYFGKPYIELGIDLVGVGGYGNYLPFIRFAESLNIPWLILSDAEPDIIKSVSKQIKESKTIRKEKDCVVFVNKGANFEKQLLIDGYENEIKDAIKAIELPKCSNKKHEAAKKNEIENYNSTKLYVLLTGSKTQFGPVVADSIVKSGKPIPPTIVSIFKKAQDLLKTKE